MEDFEKNDEMKEGTEETTQSSRRKDGETKDENSKCRNSKKACIYKLVFYAVIVIAIGVLYYLHFSSCNKKDGTIPLAAAGAVGNGDVLYINTDSINTHYELVSILNSDIEAEAAKQEALFANREKTLQGKFTQFQQNYQANVLTPVQIENTQRQLAKESEDLMAEKERILNDLQNRKMNALLQVMDSLSSKAKLVNSRRNASFILNYQYGATMFYADPAKDITNEVLEELNKPFKKK